MPVTINADIATGAAVVTADASGVLALQASGNTGLTLNSSRAIGVGASPSFGSSGQVLTSGGSAAAPTWATPSGGLTLISTTTASSSSSVVFSSLSPTAYHYYQVVAKEITASGVASFEMQVSTDNGSTFVTTAYQSQAGGFGTSAYESGRVSNGDRIAISGIFRDVYTGHLYINLFPNVSGRYFSANGLTWGSEYFNTQTGGMFSGTNAASTTAVNAIRLRVNSGTFSGIFKLYGVAA